MIKEIGLGVWCAAVALGSSYGAAYWQMNRAAHAAEPSDDAHGGGHGDAHGGHGKSSGSEAKKTRVLSVPMIADGKVNGYIVAQFAYTLDPVEMKKTTGSAENYLLDEAFRIIYADDKFDFRHFGKFDTGRLASEIQKQVNERLKVAGVKEVLVHEFNFVPRDMVRQ